MLGARKGYQVFRGQVSRANPFASYTSERPHHKIYPSSRKEWHIKYTDERICPIVLNIMDVYLLLLTSIYK